MKILCCYNVNIDSVGTIDGDRVTDYLKNHVKSTSREIGDLPDRISNMTDFLALLLAHTRNGTGGEYLLETPDAISESSLLIRDGAGPVQRLGGNAGIAASTLSALGATTVIPNVASLSQTQADLLGGAAIRIPAYRDGKIVLLKPRDAVRGDEDAIHYVFDFTRETEVKSSGEVIVAQDNNRVIATYDPKNIAIHIDPAFKEFSDAHIEEMDGVLVSGLHLLRSRYPDGSTYQDHLNPIIDELRRWKSSNPDLAIHFESGDFLDDGICDHVISCVSDVVDSIGMNEDEFLCGGLDVSAEKIIEEAERSINHLGVSRLCVHTRDFIVSIFEQSYIDCASEIDALSFGASASAARAETGRVDRALSDAVVSGISGITPSEKGVRECAIVQERFAGKRIGNGVCVELGGHLACVVPSFWCAHPVTTVGMGDTMTAAVFLRELLNRKQ